MTGKKDFPTLSLAERDRRWQVARNLMDEQGVDALLVFGDRDGAGSALWATDHWLTNDRVGANVLYPRDGLPIAHVWSTNSMVDHMESSGRGEEVWLAPDQFRLGRMAGSLLKTIGELGLEEATFGVVGIDMMMPFFPDGIVPYGTYNGVLEGLPKATFKTVGAAYGAAATLRRSEEEMRMLRRCAQVGEVMSEAAIDATRVGATDADVLAALTAACIREGCWAHWTILADGDENVSWGAPSWIYRGGPPREIKNGDILLFELMPFYGIYETQQQLAIAVGDVHPDMERAAEICEESYNAAVQALRDGAKVFGDVDQAMRKPITEAGSWSLTPNIHSLPHFGLGAFGPPEALPEMEPYPGLGAGAHPGAGADLELHPGIVLAIQPNCVFGRRRMNIGGTVVTTDSGVEELNDIPNRLVRVGK
jgi:Xaa-Pro aminopeptidase